MRVLCCILFWALFWLQTHSEGNFRCVKSWASYLTQNRVGKTRLNPTNTRLHRVLGSEPKSFNRNLDPTLELGLFDQHQKGSSNWARMLSAVIDLGLDYQANPPLVSELIPPILLEFQKCSPSRKTMTGIIPSTFPVKKSNSPGFPRTRRGIDLGIGDWLLTRMMGDLARQNTLICINDSCVGPTNLELKNQKNK